MNTFSQKFSKFVVVALAGAALFLAFTFRSQIAGRSQFAGRNSAESPSARQISSLPSTILWAWERPEKLDYVDQQKTAVAFLAKTIYLRGDQAISRPRLQPLSVSKGAKVIAVARIESEHSETPTLSSHQVSDAATEIAELGKLPNVVMVQVDFDATASQRAFYRSMLTELRSRLPENTLLSITALASWCSGDNWLDDLPIDEAVPMLFRMGVEENQFRSKLAAGEAFSAKPCRQSLGISTDEPIENLPAVERIYVFNPASWSTAEVNKVMEAHSR